LARPSGPDIERALSLVGDVFELRRSSNGTARGRARIEAEQAAALEVLREAVRPRLVMLSKEAAAVLGVDPSNLEPGSVAGLPEPAQVVPRPTVLHPDRVVRVWYADEIEACAAKRARATGANGED
jgi:hypothetical protein